MNLLIIFLLQVIKQKNCTTILDSKHTFPIVILFNLEKLDFLRVAEKVAFNLVKHNVNVMQPWLVHTDKLTSTVPH